MDPLGAGNISPIANNYASPFEVPAAVPKMEAFNLSPIEEMISQQNDESEDQVLADFMQFRKKCGHNVKLDFKALSKAANRAADGATLADKAVQTERVVATRDSISGTSTQLKHSINALQVMAKQLPSSFVRRSHSPIKSQLQPPLPRKRNL